jgi:hypothetical protein
MNGVPPSAREYLSQSARELNKGFIFCYDLSAPGIPFPHCAAPSRLPLRLGASSFFVAIVMPGV